MSLNNQNIFAHEGSFAFSTFLARNLQPKVNYLNIACSGPLNNDLRLNWSCMFEVLQAT